VLTIQPILPLRSTSPEDSKRCKASLTGVRLTSRTSANRRSTRTAPGSSSHRTIAASTASYTCSFIRATSIRRNRAIGNLVYPILHTSNVIPGWAEFSLEKWEA
jgi:hypothetical protein